MLALAFTLGTAARVVSLPFRYGQIAMSLPLVDVPPEDPGYHTYTESPARVIDERTPVVVLTHEALYFGSVTAFGKELGETRDKFVFPHDDGSPRLAEMAGAFEQWLTETGQTARPFPLVFSPAGGIPMPIVIQVIAGLKRIPRVERVILAGGII